MYNFKLVLTLALSVAIAPVYAQTGDNSLNEYTHSHRPHHHHIVRSRKDSMQSDNMQEVETTRRLNEDQMKPSQQSGNNQNMPFNGAMMNNGIPNNVNNTSPSAGPAIPNDGMNAPSNTPPVDTNAPRVDNGATGPNPKS